VCALSFPRCSLKNTNKNTGTDLRKLIILENILDLNDKKYGDQPWPHAHASNQD
jgi:hypothetical protein